MGAARVVIGCAADGGYALPLAVMLCSAASRLDHDIAAEVVMLPIPKPGPAYRRAPSPTPTLLFCGRLDVEKGAPLLLRAFARVVEQIPEARLRVAGRGPLLPELQRLVCALRVEHAVTFLGWLTPHEIEAELARAWASVAPSLFAEPLGLVALEAIVRGVPVVASARGGFAETIADGRTGLLFPNGDESALAACLLKVARGEVFASHEIAAGGGAEAALRHDVARHVARMRSIFRAVAPP